MIVNNSYYLTELNTSITKNIDNFLETKIAGNFPTQKGSCLQSTKIMTKYRYNISLCNICISGTNKMNIRFKMPSALKNITLP